MQLGSCEPQVFNLLPPSPSRTVGLVDYLEAQGVVGEGAAGQEHLMVVARRKVALGWEEWELSTVGGG